MNTPYDHLGFLSSASPERSIALWCNKCRVSWVGCQEAAECPRCGDTSAYEQRAFIDLMGLLVINGRRDRTPIQLYSCNGSEISARENEITQLRARISENQARILDLSDLPH